MDALASMSTGLLIVYLICAYHLWKLIRLARANADLHLLSKKQLAPQAFNDQAVWIIGASQGLGRELALQLSRSGARVVLSARNEGKLQEVAELCREGAKHPAAVVPLDVTWPQDRIQGVAERVCGRGPMDFIFYATGASQRARVESADPSTAQQIMDINTLGAMRVASAALPHMLQRAHGRFVIVSSMAAVVPAPGQSAYSAAKSGLNAYFETLATELSGRGVGVTICCPGPIAGQPGVDRAIYGPQGLVTASWPRSSSHMKPQAVAELILRAAHHKVSLCWIAKHPVLLIAYINQYWPTLGRVIMQRIGPGRVESMEGKTGSGYDWMGFLRRATRASKTC
ncbi:hypothetical protein WJX73_008262 [Symbiochloris irregularis]|uniref:Ketoreductase domain-containing protein n=1 Tax=Symbiochloris irregularis TaxID=706552 RepID=A0AAW1PUU2_9CHLO